MTQDLASYDHFPLSVASCAFSFSRSLALQARQHVFASSPCANLETLLSETPSPGSGSWSLTWRQWVAAVGLNRLNATFLNGGDFWGLGAEDLRCRSSGLGQLALLYSIFQQRQHP